MLTDQHRSKLKSILINFDIYLKHNLRLFIEAILHLIRTECPWRDLPEAFCKPNSIFQRFNRWCKDSKLLKLLSSGADLEWIFIDASYVRAHQHEAGIKAQSTSKSIGGNSSKIHLAVNANGNPIELMIGDGTTHDVKVAPDLIDCLDLEETEISCADKGYDSELFREKIKNTKTNIPKKCNSKSSNENMDWYL